ncbi:MAG: hypothetical protein WB495_08935 [Xanthobacteraceae bacterium]
MNATARYVGVLIGPAVGGVLLLWLGPAHGILLNTLFYLPLVLWLVKAPYGPNSAPAARRRRGRCGGSPTSCRRHAISRRIRSSSR